MKLTPHLKNLLEQYKNSLDEDEFLSFEKEVLRLFNDYSKHLSSFTPGLDRGQELHRLIDQQVSQSSDIKTTCKKGCGFCCHLEIEITSDDAEVLWQSLKSYPGTIDFNRLTKQSKRSRLDSKWAQGITADNRCVFLSNDQSCSNYENRPAICRKHSVVSPVVECEKLEGSPVPKIIPIAEIIMSAAISLPEIRFASFAKMLKSRIDAAAAIAKVPEQESNM
ncbi:MAG: YkgJ family cysteine cluster protein [Pseudobdellovibrionaceae bacterium]